jgi:hypothetical protein
MQIALVRVWVLDFEQHGGKKGWAYLAGARRRRRVRRRAGVGRQRLSPSRRREGERFNGGRMNGGERVKK